MTTEEASFDDLYRRHAPNAFRRARRLLGNDADAQELVQDVFVSLFERPAQFGERSTFTTFLYSAVTNACLNRIRNRRNRLRLLRREPSTPEPYDRKLSAEQLATLHGLIERIPEHLARVAIYYCVDELTHDDIARILGCSRRQVGKLLEQLSEWGRAQEKVR
jgi:RNA polymerase sigma factor (sigma-70 family)